MSEELPKIVKNQLLAFDPRESSIFSNWYSCKNCNHNATKPQFEDDSWECPICSNKEKGEPVTKVYRCVRCGLVATDKDFLSKYCDCSSSTHS